MRVVKIGGRAQGDPRFVSALAEAWNNSPKSLCVVHGGGDDISSMQRALGREPTFINGRRVTSESDLDLLRMVLSGLVNKRLVNSLVAAGIPAVGVSGEDDSLIGAKIIDADSLGFAGQPTTVNVQLLRAFIVEGYMPVISPVGYDVASGKGGALNINGDDAAAAIAAALGAEELLLIADVEGVLDAQGDLVQVLSVESSRDLIASGVAGGGMAAKLESAHAALLAGVERVRICGIAGLADSERGTFITQSQGVIS